jgi:lactoylglutathione lyase
LTNIESGGSLFFDIHRILEEHPMTAITNDFALADQPAPTPDGGRVQLALNVDDLDSAVAFYAKLFGTPPAKVRPGYANFAIAAPPLKLVLLENPGEGGTLNHLGVEVGSSEIVHGEIERLTNAGLFTAEEIGTTCCFATQDKVWVQAPGGERWEVYTVLADSQTFGSSPKTAAADGAAETCCGAAAGASETAACC